MGLLFELVEVLAGLSVTLSAVSAISKFIKKKGFGKQAPPKSETVTITSTSGQNAQVQMSAEDVDQLVHR